MIVVKRGLHITHNDADAVGCAIVVSYIDPTNIEWDHAYNNVHGASEAIEKLFFGADEGKYEHLIISDISITEEVAEKLDRYKNEHPNFNLCLVDHHKTNKLAGKYPWVSVIVEDKGIKVSAAYNLFNIFYTRILESSIKEDINILVIDEVIQSISRYDTWEWKKHPKDNPDEDNFMIITKTIGCGSAACQILNNIENSTDHYEWDEASMMLINLYRKNEVSVIEDTPKRTVFTRLTFNEREYNCALLICDSTYGNRQMTWLYENNPDIEISVGLYPETRTIELRTDRPDIDVSEIAKCYNGGGHVGAAGCKPSIPFFLDLLEIYYNERENK